MSEIKVTEGHDLGGQLLVLSFEGTDVLIGGHETVRVVVVVGSLG